MTRKVEVSAMAITRWDPFQDMLPLRDAMNQLFEQSLVRTADSRMAGRGWALPLDVFTTDDGFVIEAALPGLDPDAVTVTVLGNQVAISGEFPAAPEGRSYLFRERPVGRFERTVTLPTDLDADKAEAHYAHGLMRLTVPKAESARPRRIALSAQS
jgi:HSP20 family protein